MSSPKFKVGQNAKIILKSSGRTYLGKITECDLNGDKWEYKIVNPNEMFQNYWAWEDSIELVEEEKECEPAWKGWLCHNNLHEKDTLNPNVTSKCKGEKQWVEMDTEKYALRYWKEPFQKALHNGRKVKLINSNKKVITSLCHPIDSQLTYYEIVNNDWKMLEFKEV